MIDINLPPIKKDTSAHAIFSEEPTVCIISGLSGSLQNALSTLMLSPKWSSDKAPEILNQIISNRLPQAIKNAVPFSRSLQKALNKTAFAPSSKDRLPSPDEIRLPALNDKFIRDSFLQNEAVFEELNMLLKMPTRGKEGELLRLLRSLSAALRSGPVNSLPKAYALLRDAVANPDYTVPFYQTQSLHLLMFLPYRLRRAVQKTLIHNNTIDYLRHHVEKRDHASFIEARKCFEDLLRLDARSSDHWRQLMMEDEYQAPEDFVLEIGSAARSLSTRIKEFHTLAAAADVIKAALESQDKRRSCVQERLNKIGPTRFHAVDVGHCFQPSFNFLKYAEPSSKTKLQPKKDGRQAAIFEDDPEQARIYHSWLNESSTFISPDDPGFTSDKADQILSLVDSAPKIGLFLIDIAQPDNQWAGLDLVLKLLPKLAEKLPPYSERQEQNKSVRAKKDKSADEGAEESSFFSDGRPKRVSIVLWSSSKDLANHAEKAIEEFLEKNSKLKERIASPDYFDPKTCIGVRVFLKTDTCFLNVL